MLSGLGGDFHAALVVGSAFAGEYALDFAELTANLYHHLGGGAAHGVHGETAEEEGHHGADEYAREHGGIHERHMEVIEDVEYACVGGLDELSAHGHYLLAYALQRYLDLFDVRRQQGQCGEGRAADGKALAGCCGGVAESVQDVSALAHFRLQFAHLGVAARIVGDGAVGVCGEGDAQGGEHTHGCDGHAVETLGQGGGGHHVLHVEADGEEICQHDCADDCDDRNGGRNHTQSDTVDNDGCGAGLGGLCQLLGGFIGVRSVVFGGLADDHACEQTSHYRAAEVPPVGGGCAEHECQDAEGGHAAEDGCHVGAEAHALEELAHAGAFLGADGEDGDNAEHHAHSRDEHRGEDGLDLHLGAECVEGRSAESHGGQDTAAVALVEVGSHTGHVAHVVAHVVGDGSGVAGIVFRKVAFHLTYDVGAHVGGLGVDAAAHTGEEGLRGGTHSEGEHGGGDDHELLGVGGLDHECVKDYIPQCDVQQAEADDREAHYRAAAERDLEAGV